MTNKGFTLDTNIVSAYLKGDMRVGSKIKTAIRVGLDLKINGIAYYEVKRGVEDLQNPEKFRKLEEMCQEFGLLLIDDKNILDHASRLWAGLKKKGQLLEDADILVASIAMIKGYTLVSHDTDFDRIDGLRVENWLR